MSQYTANVTGQPYIRVRRIEIDYDAPGEAQVHCVETLAVPLIDGSVAQLGDRGAISFPISAADFAEELQLVDPDTGAPIPGATMTIQQVMLGILAVIRSRQIARDARETSAG